MYDICIITYKQHKLTQCLRYIALVKCAMQPYSTANSNNNQSRDPKLPKRCNAIPTLMVIIPHETVIHVDSTTVTTQS